MIAFTALEDYSRPLGGFSFELGATFGVADQQRRTLLPTRTVCLFRTQTVSFELEMSKTSFQGPFRRKAPIGNEVAKPRRTLPINSLRPSSGIIADHWVLFRTRTVSFELELSKSSSFQGPPTHGRSLRPSRGIITDHWVLFRTRTVSFELELSKSSFADVHHVSP